MDEVNEIHGLSVGWVCVPTVHCGCRDCECDEVVVDGNPVDSLLDQQQRAKFEPPIKLPTSKSKRKQML